MNYAEAYQAVLDGKSIQREGWNGKGLHVKMDVVTDTTGKQHKTTVIVYPNGEQYLWQPSPTDVVNGDWSVVL